MLKKTILAVALLGLVSFLVVGAVNRTIAKTDDSGESHETRGQGWAQQTGDNLYVTNNEIGQGQGRNQEGSGQEQVPGQRAQAEDAVHNEKTGGQGQGRNQEGSGQEQVLGQRAQAEAAAQNTKAGGQGQGGGREVAGSAGQSRGGQAEQVTWQAMEGTVVAVDDESLTLSTENGDLEIADRGWRFALEQGFSAQVGQRIGVQGFLEEGKYEVGSIANLSSGQLVQIREQSGRPLWAGGAGGGGPERVDGDSQPAAEAEDHQWQQVMGEVVNVDDEQITLKLADGELQIEGRPWSFALMQGFHAQRGDLVIVNGFLENGEFEAGVFQNGGLIVPVREESGRPLWAGQGRGRVS
ncbi:MAG: hypothetical protein U9R25_02780 [Chloroflexota bacterium]|nr:hypothetical protein [Chloroflexota bacterium]